MQRNEFLAIAEQQLDEAFGKFKNRVMNIIRNAWAEGRRNSEVRGVTDVLKSALEGLHMSNPELPIHTETIYMDPRVRAIEVSTGGKEILDAENAEEIDAVLTGEIPDIDLQPGTQTVILQPEVSEEVQAEVNATQELQTCAHTEGMNCQCEMQACHGECQNAKGLRAEINPVDDACDIPQEVIEKAIEICEERLEKGELNGQSDQTV